MAKVFIEEFAGSAIDGHYDAPATPPLASQVVAIGAGSTPSAPFNANTRIIRVTSDAVASIAIGLTPVATSNSFRLPAGYPHDYGVRPGDSIAVITNT